MKLILGERVLGLPPGSTIVVEPGEAPCQLILVVGEHRRVLTLAARERATIADHVDFRPGDRIVGPKGKRYTVADPVRSRRGLLRLKGPLGGSTTRPWQVDQLPDGYRREELSLGG